MVLPSSRIVLAFALYTASLVGPAAQARIGESVNALVGRFGEPRHVSSEPASLGTVYQFVSDNWLVEAVVIGGRCEKITYRQPGNWSEGHYERLLAGNAADSPWEEIPSSAEPRVLRTWIRRDGATCAWMRMTGLVITTAAYREAEAKTIARSAPAKAKPSSGS
ncbi:hypothetical protein ASA1KI_33030 [Opitutales bacterium ASA1]|uniref:hypothetical protein n=1 Tax=Congregicoccus parvus TaxID=3081749 RepID=UPI002B2FD87C|nr:hypothetical protein ASA1KI_33030 [Opitutales bacterium ASA1]